MKAKTKTTKKPAASKVKKPVKKVAKKPTKPTKKKVSKINKKDNETGAKIVDLLKNTLAPTATPKVSTASAAPSKPKVATIGTCTQAQVKSTVRFSATPVVKTRFVAAGVSPKTNMPVTLVASK